LKRNGSFSSKTAVAQTNLRAVYQLLDHLLDVQKLTRADGGGQSSAIQNRIENFRRTNISIITNVNTAPAHLSAAKTRSNVFAATSSASPASGRLKSNILFGCSFWLASPSG
jgi:hypothetical protein